MRHSFQEEKFDARRLSSLGDGVFSIAMTLSVFEVAGKLTSEEILKNGGYQEFNVILPLLGQYLGSFLITAIYWIAFQRIGSWIHTASKKLVYTHIYFFAAISLIPLMIKFSGVGETGSIQVYALYMSVTGFILNRTWVVAVKEKASDGLKNMSDFDIRWMWWRTLLPCLLFAFSALVAFIDPNVARFSWFGLFFYQHLTEKLASINHRIF